ncbi:MAG: T9SS type A sorting domain-containing protein, partial [FCB group bacterium]|nr:T9SS type A sorting domain-containing protein [FCB group bacterium]
IDPLVGEVWEGTDSIDIDWQSSTTNLDVYWTGSDSRALEYFEWTLSTSPGDSDLVSWINIGNATHYLATNLSLTEGSTYFSNIRAIDDAGNRSFISSSDGVTIDITPPVSGAIFIEGISDNHFINLDNIIVVHWVGFTDGLSGINRYLYAVGSTPGDNDIFPWTGNGIDTIVTISNLSLPDGQSYFVSLQAVDFAGNASSVVISDQITVDISPPVIGEIRDGLTEDVDWTNQTICLNANWLGCTDSLSGIRYYEYSIGTSPGNIDVLAWGNIGIATAEIDSGLNLQNEMTYYANLRATDHAGNVSAVGSSDGISVDLVPPTVTYIHEGLFAQDLDFTGTIDTLQLSWNGYDEPSGIQFFEYALGTTVGDSNIRDWTELNLDTTVTLRGLQLTEGQTYHGNVRITDIAGNQSTIGSGDGIIPDITPPIPGAVNDGSDVDVDYIASDSTVTINWTGFHDEISGISSYQYALGTAPGGSDVVGFIPADSADQVIVSGLSLSEGTMYYSSIMATDQVGNTSSIQTSDGFKIDLHFGAPYILAIDPEPGAVLDPRDESIIRFELSESITTYHLGINSGINSGYSFTHQYIDDIPPFIELHLTGPLAYSDTLLFNLDDYFDVAGLLGDSMTYVYYLPMLADYEQNWEIDINDLNRFVDNWNNNRLTNPVTLRTNELGPVSGEPPYFILTPDSVFNIRDVMGFTRMWNWSHQNSPAVIASIVHNLGDPPLITQQGRQLWVRLPEGVRVGQLVVQYPNSMNQIECLTGDSTLDRIILQNKDMINNQFLVEFANLNQASNKPLVLSTHSLSSQTMNLSVSYTFFSEDDSVISQGRQEVELIAVPDQYALLQNYPNPFNPVTTIKYNLPENSLVTLVVYNLLGREVIKLVNENQTAGYKTIRWDGRDTYGRNVSTGMYFYAIRAGEYSAIRKMVLLK